ncbi:MAG: hypothetical protein Fur002_15660 [Anaerolineales bacterium]
MKRFLPFTLVIAAITLAACGGAKLNAADSYELSGAGGAPEAPMYALPPMEDAASIDVANRAGMFRLCSRPA